MNCAGSRCAGLLCPGGGIRGLALTATPSMPGEIRIITEKSGVCEAAAPLFHRAFNLRFDRLPEEQERREKLIFQITDPAKRSASSASSATKPQTLAMHINFGVLEEDCCRTSFLRGRFSPAAASPTRKKRYHLELAGVPWPGQPGGVGPC